MKEIGPRERHLREMREARVKRNSPNPFEDAARGRDPAPKSSGGHVRHEAKAVSRATDAGVAPSPPETNSGAPWPRREPVQMKTARPTGSQIISVLAAEPATAPAVHGGQSTGRTAGSNPATGAKRSRGRPKKEGLRPWETEGISRAQYYRNQAEKRK